MNYTNAKVSKVTTSETRAIGEKTHENTVESHETFMVKAHFLVRFYDPL
jgi:hypothetical protein